MNATVTLTVTVNEHPHLPSRQNDPKSYQVNLTIKLHDCSVDGETGFAAICAEFPEANGQGETREQCLTDLRASIEDILAYRRDEAKKSVLRGEKLETMPA